MMLWGKASMFILSMEVNVHGIPPEPPFFIVTNHLSYLDIPAYSAVLKTTFVSKSEIKHWPLVGFMARSLGIIFINRKVKSDVHRVNNEISNGVNQKQGVLLFPEGTTSPGTEVLRFRPSLLEHAAKDNLPVHYAAIRYETGSSDEPAYKSVCWWGDMPLGSHLLKMGSNRKIYVDITFGDEIIKSDDRKVLAGKLEESVNKIFKPVVQQMDESFEPLEF